MKDKPKIFLIVKIVAFIMLIVGLILIILGTAVYPDATFSDMPNMGLFMPGIFLTFFSIPCFVWGFTPELHKVGIKTKKYLQEENKGDLTDMASTSADITSGAATKTAKAVKDGLKDTKYCRYCGEQIEADSKFCKHCGKEQ